MTWNYRVAKKNAVDYDGSNITLYGLIGVYYNEQGEPYGWSDFIDPNGWDDIDDLKGTLELMLRDFDKPVFEQELGEKE